MTLERLLNMSTEVLYPRKNFYTPKTNFWLRPWKKRNSPATGENGLHRFWLDCRRTMQSIPNPHALVFTALELFMMFGAAQPLNRANAEAQLSHGETALNSLPGFCLGSATSQPTDAML